ncbi:MAG: iron-containing alcohol dehydrogenase [Thermoanaerobaculia bacterium]
MTLHFLEDAVPGALRQLCEAEEVTEVIVGSSIARREVLYRDLLSAVQRADPETRTLASDLTIADLSSIPLRRRGGTILVIGGGRLIDSLKILCERSDRDLVALPTSLSNDGFASGCSSLPKGPGGAYETRVSRRPRAVWCLASLLRRAPVELLASGVGELLSKYNVIEDVRPTVSEERLHEVYDEPVRSIDRLAAAMPGLRDSGEFITELAHSLYRFSILMQTDSELCSRSEHEFEKACLAGGVVRPHGLLVTVGALVAMRLRSAPTRSPQGFAVCTYENLLERNDRLGLATPVLECLRAVLGAFRETKMQRSLAALSTIRPSRFGLWNEIDSHDVDWLAVLRDVERDLAQRANPGVDVTSRHEPRYRERTLL